MTTGVGTTTRVRLALEGATAVQQGLAKVEGSVSSAAKSIVGLAGGLSVAGFATWIKGAINAADESAKLAQRAGLAVNQVAGLQLAFGQSGVSAEQFVPVMAKLGVAVTNGNKALTAMGIATQNADGSLKSTRQVLGEVSDKFAGYQDGAAKTALAVGLLGEEGAKLLPLLNQGASGLDQYDQMAKQLGLTLDTSTAKAAEQFNDTIDLMGKATSGVASQVAARLLPTLNTLAGELFRSLTQGDALNTVVNILSGTMKGLYSVAVGVVTAFKTVGTALGGVGAAIAAVISGDFAGVRMIISTMASDISASWASAGGSIIKVWEAAGDSTVAALTQAAAAMQGTAPAVAAATKATKQLSDAERELADERKRDLAAGVLRNKLAGEVYQAEQKRIEEERRASEDRMQTARGMLESIERETALMGMSNDERERSAMLWELERQGVVAGTEAYEAFITKLDDARFRRSAAKAAQEYRQEQVAEWKRANDQIAQSLTDSLFDGGKSFLDNLASYARTIMLRPIIAPVGTALASAIGGPAAAATDAGSPAGMLGSVAQLAGMSSALGTGIAAGFANALAGTFSGSLAAAGSLIGTGTAAGISSGIGMGIGTIAPYALAAFAAYKLLTADTPGEQHRGGYYSSLGYTGLEGAARITGSGPNSGQSRDLITRADQAITDQVRASVDAIVSSVSGMAQTLGQDIALGLDLGFAANTNGRAGNSNAFGYFGVSANGQLVRTSQNRNLGSDAAAAYEALTTEAASALADIVLGGTGLVRTDENSLQTLQALSTSLQTVNAIFDTLGTTAYQVGLQGGDMARQLADLFGGLDAFNTAATAYYQAFYSEGERTATAARQLGVAMQALGLQLPDTRDQFRGLVEAQDLTTEAGRQTYATLLSLAPAFADLTKAAETAGQGIRDEITRLRGLSGGATTAQGYAALQARFATTTAAARAGSASALEELPSISQALEEAASLQARTAGELRLIRQQMAASLAATLGTQGLQVPALATGTNYVPHDMLVMAHQGEAVVPKAYNPAAGSGLGGGDSVAELRAIRQRLEAMSTRLEQMELGVVAVAGHTAKTARILDRAAPTGDALLVMSQAEFDTL